jgi:glycosyltransferase involved in cell wall biosynthesis
VHAIHNSAIDHDVLARIDPALPTVWTFHDHWGFSPESYQLVVNGTPLRVKPDGPDREAAQARRRRYFDSRRRLHLAGNSHDTSAYAARLLGRDVETIHYGVPLDLHRPVDRVSARRALQLPEDDFVVGFSADVTADPVKGFDVLEAALVALRGTGVRGVAMGTSAQGEHAIGGVPVHVLGRIDNPVLQSIVYSAADLFVVPSRVEALGQVAMESIACGTPVVASNVGGLPDVVREGETGWLVPPGDAGALADVLRRAREDARAGSMRARCREHAEREWSLATPARRYRAVYEGLAR